MLKAFSIFFIAFLLSPLVHAAYDFNGAIIDPVKVTLLPSGYKSIQFQIKINNTGDEEFSGQLRVKPFLLADDCNRTSSLLQKGASLDTLVTAPIVIPANSGSITLNYEATLPLMRGTSYQVAAFINNDQGIVETNTMDNVTNMVSAGRIQVTSAPAEAGPIDLTSQYSGNLVPTRGGVKDLLRTIASGTNTSFPSKNLWARFMLADMKSKKIYTAPYVNYGTSTHTTCLNRPNTDKNWFAISYAREFDMNGNEVFVDYYNQSPCFEDYAPGEYAFITLLNTRDLVPESDTHNNLNSQPLWITPILRDTRMSEVWFVQTNNEASLTQTYKFNSTYMKRNAWWVSLPSNIPGLSSDIGNGMIGGEGGVIPYGQSMTLTMNTAGTTGHLSGDMDINSQVFSGHTQRVPVKFFKYAAGTEPVLDLPIPEVSITASMIPGLYYGNLALVNDGNSQMVWKAATEDTFLFLSQSSGVIEPHSKILLSVILDTNMNNSRSLRLSKIKLLTNTAVSSRDINVNINWQ